jgi:hypothetical protein
MIEDDPRPGASKAHKSGEEEEAEEKAKEEIQDAFE